MKSTLIFSFLVLLFTVQITTGQTDDSTFGTYGYIPHRATGNSQENDGIGTNSEIQSDGKIFTGIDQNDANVHSDLDFYTYRYNPVGSPDATFGINGVSGVFEGD